MQEEIDKAPKTKIGDDVAVLGIWRNCKFDIVKVKTEREVVQLPNGERVEQETARATDQAAAQLPPRDPACDNVEPSPEQIERMRADVEAEQAKLAPGRPVRPGGAPGRG